MDFTINTEPTSTVTYSEAAKPIVFDKKLRYRVNVARGVKGGYSFDCTVEGEGYSMNDIIERSDELVKSLNSRYPSHE